MRSPVEGPSLALDSAPISSIALCEPPFPSSFSSPSLPERPDFPLFAPIAARAASPWETLPNTARPGWGAQYPTRYTVPSPGGRAGPNTGAMEALAGISSLVGAYNAYIDVADEPSRGRAVAQQGGEVNASSPTADEEVQGQAAAPRGVWNTDDEDNRGISDMYPVTVPLFKREEQAAGCMGPFAGLTGTG